MPSTPPSPVSTDSDTAPTPLTPPDKGRRRVQMIDIARMAGVSTSTVSRALSGSTLIPEATRNRITELARSLHYRVNVGAANLRKGDLQTIGVVLLSDSTQMISDPFVLGILGSLTDTVNDLGMNLLLTRLQEGRQDQMRSMVESGQVSGLVVIGQLSLHDHLNELALQGIPMAVWGAALEGASYPVVGGDNFRGGYLATRHLIEKGCRRIAFFGDAAHPEASLRFRGYERALQEAGIEPDPRLRQHYLFGDARIRETIDGWLNQHLDFDAIFTCSDVTAISLMGALRERSVPIPEQVRVVGYDDILLARHVHPTLTTVRQPIELAGRALVELLFESIAGAPRRNIALPTELVERDSSR